jgi:hypothetical protein
MTALFMVSSCRLTQEDELFNKFENPPSEAKPFVRWWWGENSVAEKEILREIEVMDKAGLGRIDRAGKNSIRFPSMMATDILLLHRNQIEVFKTLDEEVNTRCDLKLYKDQPHGFFNYSRNKEMYYKTIQGKK